MRILIQFTRSTALGLPPRARTVACSAFEKQDRGSRGPVFVAKADEGGSQDGLDMALLFADLESEHVAIKRGAAADISDRQKSHRGAGDLFRALVIQLRLQRAPARESVLARDVQ